MAGKYGYGKRMVEGSDGSSDPRRPGCSVEMVSWGRQYEENGKYS